MPTETLVEHYFWNDGQMVKGFDSGPRHHVCGETGACVTYTYKREVSTWERVDVRYRSLND